MTFGLSESDYQILNDYLILPLKTSYAKVYVFGSRARGQNHPFSDIDILFEEDPQHPIPIERISLFKDRLENSNMTVKVDLVNWNNLAESYKPSVLKDRILI